MKSIWLPLAAIFLLPILQDWDTMPPLPPTPFPRFACDQSKPNNALNSDTRIKA